MPSRCIIFTSYIEGEINDITNLRPNDHLVCADGGFTHLRKSGLTPDVIIGDFDSLSFDETSQVLKSDPQYHRTEIIKLPSEKDDTDTYACAKYGVDNGFDDFVIVGGLGGRLDHTIANLQTLSYLVDHGKTASITDQGQNMTMLKGSSEITLKPGVYDSFSAFSYTDNCAGVCEKGSKYELDDATLNNSFPIGTSNEFIGKPVTVSVKTGKLLLLQFGG